MMTNDDVGQVEKAGFAPLPMGYWNSEKGKNMRAFFENFAKRNRFDPLVAENWYRFTRDAVAKVEVYLREGRRERGGR